ncbi:hypothetical protein TSOC_004157 [Tetrabaena socialis]|uniref:phytol kinase n=1 Tax=Tetrabaena socialis TaxID=47790 RepID=A0A2J8A9Q1_9CHLO|nr:hypothetical protein TSOC_004157 [Tetrabaena socialis]|eukprot:PNH09240.1 hypothetical protein TSOC_004157 [Tetrabaena socialis]
MSSSAQQPAISRPAQAAAILRSLAGLAERLRASPPPSTEKLRELTARLQELQPLISNGTAAPALLSNAAARAALLSVLSVALRQPLAGSALAQGSGAGREELRPQRLSYNDIAYWAAICCYELLRCKLPPLHAKRQLGFALRLVRTQPLQCWARRLAEMGPELLSLQRDLEQGEGGPQEEQHGEAAGSDAAPAQLRQREVCEAADVLSQSLHMVEALICFAKRAAPPHSELAQLQQELAAALRDSCVLEHTARALLLLAPLLRVRPAGNGDSEDALHACVLRIVGFMTCVVGYVVQLHLTDASIPSATSEPSTLAAALHELLSGRCVRHAVLVLGVAALCAADGGPSCGLPSELLRYVPVVGQREGPDGARGEVMDLRHANGRVLLDPQVLNNAVHMLRCGVPGALPGRPGALALLLRVCRLLVASGRTSLGGGDGVAEAEATVRHEGGGIGGSSSSCRGGGPGGSGRQRELPAAPPRPQLQLLLAPGALQRYFHAALAEVMRLCFPARPVETREMEAARAECWQLFAAYTRGVRPLQLWDVYLASPVQYLEDPGMMMSGEPLCATPLPSWAAALAGGWPRHLERLLRRGGEDPAGPEARLAVNSLFLNGWVSNRTAWRRLAVLLAYGEPRQAAALVATLGKLLRAADPLQLAGTAPEDFEVPAAAALWALTGAVNDWEGLRGGAPSAASEAEGQAQGGLPGGVQSAAGRQLTLMVSAAACQWLPPLARLAMRAMERSEERMRMRKAALLLLPLLSWLPLLARHCSTAATGEAAAAVGGVTAAVSGAGGVGPGDPGGGGPHSPSGGEWTQLLLEEVGAVPLLGAALHMLSGADAAATFIIPGDVRRLLVRACCAVAVACPREVRAAVARAATGQELVAAAGREGGTALKRGGQGSQPAAAAPAIGAAPVPHAEFPWRPQQLRALAAGVWAERRGTEADGASALAMLLQWEAGGGEGLGESELSQAGVEAEARPQKPMGLRTAWRLVEECSTCTDHYQLLPPLALVPVAEARAALRTCSHPGCVILAGDSEAEVGSRLLPCVWCGVARYCGGDCQAAHWVAGHREACVPRG